MALRKLCRSNVVPCRRDPSARASDPPTRRPRRPQSEAGARATDRPWPPQGTKGTRSQRRQPSCFKQGVTEACYVGVRGTRCPVAWARLQPGREFEGSLGCGTASRSSACVTQTLSLDSFMCIRLTHSHPLSHAHTYMLTHTHPMQPKPREDTERRWLPLRPPIGPDCHPHMQCLSLDVWRTGMRTPCPFRKDPGTLSCGPGCAEPPPIKAGQNPRGCPRGPLVAGRGEKEGADPPTAGSVYRVPQNSTGVPPMHQPRASPCERVRDRNSRSGAPGLCRAGPHPWSSWGLPREEGPVGEPRLEPEPHRAWVLSTLSPISHCVNQSSLA